MGAGFDSFMETKRMESQLDFKGVDRLVGQLKEFATKAFREGKSVDVVERHLYAELTALGHQLLGAIIVGAGDGDVGPTVEKYGRSFKRLPRRTRRYRSIFGDFQIEPVVYGTTPSEAIRSIPLDEHLGLPENDYSLVLESWTGMLARDSSFHRAIERLEAVLGIHMPLDSSERIEGRLGKVAALVLDDLPSIDPDTEAEIIVQTSDNKGIPMVRPPAEWNVAAEYQAG
jgi:hypothetical protein